MERDVAGTELPEDVGGRETPLDTAKPSGAGGEGKPPMRGAERLCGGCDTAAIPPEGCGPGGAGR